MMPHIAELRRSAASASLLSPDDDGMKPGGDHAWFRIPSSAPLAGGDDHDETAGMMEWHDVDSVVIGGGVVGLAVARALALAGWSPLLLEKNGWIGEETSARNSEVIHAGLYYAEGSLKGRLCVEGKQALYRFCAERGVPHRNTGKLIVAADPGEVAALERIDAAARANGVDDLVFLTREETLRREPGLDVAGALWSPSTGIVDSHAYMLALIGDAEAHGAEILCSATVVGGETLTGGGAALRVRGGDGALIGLRARVAVNAAGLWAQRVAERIDGIDPTTIPPQRLVKGSYFALAGAAPFSTLVYPAPGGGGLGVHLTLDMAGRARFGPDAEWLAAATPETLDYAVDPSRRSAFYAAIRRYWPALPDGALSPDYAGVRPKIAAQPDRNADFRIDGPRCCGASGCVMLYGIESPGLTASLAIGREVLERICER
jgi:L-2-hydroxyglutarate oxidase LhgO